MQFQGLACWGGNCGCSKCFWRWDGQPGSVVFQGVFCRSLQRLSASMCSPPYRHTGEIFSADHDRARAVRVSTVRRLARMPESGEPIMAESGIYWVRGTKLQSKSGAG
jgi:hypothetical protein